MEGKAQLLEPPAKRRCRKCGNPGGQLLTIRVEGTTVVVTICPACDKWRAEA